VLLLLDVVGYYTLCMIMSLPNSTSDTRSSSSSNSHTKKRSRWGGGVETPAGATTTTTTTTTTTAVSDEEALQALLASANVRQEELHKQQQHHHQLISCNAKSSSSQQQQQQQPNKKRHNTNSTAATNGKKDDYYGPASSSSASSLVADNRHHHDEPKEDSTAAAAETKKKQQQQPNFGLSGALARDTRGGNVYKGVLLKFREPPEARTPKNTQWRLYVFKNDAAGAEGGGANKQQQPKILQTLHIAKQSAYLIGRHADICDICIQHDSCSLQHAVLQYRAVPTTTSTSSTLQCQPYIMDLESTNGTRLNGVRLDPARYYQLKRGDVLQFGASTREYVLLTANTTTTTT
jgi:smad nuclear-interacting protein 1